MLASVRSTSNVIFTTCTNSTNEHAPSQHTAQPHSTLILSLDESNIRSIDAREGTHVGWPWNQFLQWRDLEPMEHRGHPSRRTEFHLRSNVRKLNPLPIFRIQLIWITVDSVRIIRNHFQPKNAGIGYVQALNQNLNPEKLPSNSLHFSLYPQASPKVNWYLASRENKVKFVSLHWRKLNKGWTPEHGNHSNGRLRNSRIPNPNHGFGFTRLWIMGSKSAYGLNWHRRIARIIRVNVERWF